MKIKKNLQNFLSRNYRTILLALPFHKVALQKLSARSKQMLVFDMVRILVYLWSDQIKGRDPVMEIEYLPVEWGKEYDIVHNSENF